MPGQSPPPFPPISPDLLKPSFQDEKEQTADRSRPSRHNLALLQDTSFNSYLPYCWGFTIYRVQFNGDSDERFTQALKRLDTWLRFIVRGSRYNGDEGNIWQNCPQFTPRPDSTNDPTDELANRLYNQVIKDYPNSETVITGPEGQEDFTLVGVAFSQLVASLNVNLDLSRHNPRYDHCLIIDRTVLEVLETLPDTPPSVTHMSEDHPENHNLSNLLHNTWIWILDRETAKALRRGEKKEFPPWLRLRIDLFQSLWFWRVRGDYITYTEWQAFAEEDTKKWETVRWWNPYARTYNQVKREMRAPGYMFGMDLQ